MHLIGSSRVAPVYWWWGDKKIYLLFQNKQSARTPKTPEQFSCQVFLEKLTIKHITVNEKAMWKRIKSDTVKEGCLQDDWHSYAGVRCDYVNYRVYFVLLNVMCPAQWKNVQQICFIDQKSNSMYMVLIQQGIVA